MFWHGVFSFFLLFCFEISENIQECNIFLMNVLHKVIRVEIIVAIIVESISIDI